MKFIPLISIIFFTLPTLASAASSVVNTVSVTATSGGNTVNGGEVKQGNASGSVQVKTIINGETVEDFNETYTGDTSVTKEFNYATGSVDTAIKTFISTGTSSQKTNLSKTLDVKAGELLKGKLKAEAGKAAQFGRAEKVASSSSATTSPQRKIPATRLQLFISKILDHVFSLFSF